MRRIIFIGLMLLMCSSAFALDWHVGVQAAITEDENIESAIDFGVAHFSAKLEARQTDYSEATLIPAELETNWCNYQLWPAQLVYDEGLQWRVVAHYDLGKHGPVLGYTHISDQDEAGFVGWRVEFGSR